MELLKHKIVHLDRFSLKRRPSPDIFNLVQWKHTLIHLKNTAVTLNGQESWWRNFSHTVFSSADIFSTVVTIDLVENQCCNVVPKMHLVGGSGSQFCISFIPGHPNFRGPSKLTLQRGRISNSHLHRLQLLDKIWWFCNQERQSVMKETGQYDYLYIKRGMGNYHKPRISICAEQESFPEAFSM